MSEEAKTILNWVDRKAQREALLSAQSSEVWNDVRAALQDACESFRQHYAGEVTCKPENGKRIRIVHTIPANRTTSLQDSSFDVVVEFEDGKPSISATYQSGVAQFLIDADQENVFLLEGKERKTVDQISERILRNVLFPPQQKPPRRAIRFVPPGGYRS